MLHSSLKRDPDVRDVRPREARVERPRRVVEQPSSGADLRDVLLIRRRIERDHQVEGRRPRGVAVTAHPDLVPGRQPLNVGRKDVLARHRHAHSEDRLHEEPVGRGGARAVRGRNLEREVVGSIHGQISYQLPATSFPLCINCEQRAETRTASTVTRSPKFHHQPSRVYPSRQLEAGSWKLEAFFTPPPAVSPVRPARHTGSAARTCACPTRTSGTVRRTTRSAGRHSRP